MNNQDLKIRMENLDEEQKHTQKSNEAMYRQKKNHVISYKVPLYNISIWYKIHKNTSHLII